MTEQERINKLIEENSKLRGAMLSVSGQALALAQWSDGETAKDFKRIEARLDQALADSKFDEIIFNS
tara:strand:- start:544 stop:744 length:201 start_codon:yes stop_codon:yes gene_type:complete